MYRTQANVVNGHTFTVSSRYSFNDAKILGRGSFGVVATSLDLSTNQIIAIKRIRPYCNDEWDARHTLREIILMRLLGPHPNIISLHNLSINEEKSEMYMMIELMDCDLHRVIQSKQTLTPKHFKCFVKQILEGIKAMHSVGVFHRDLKPGNILVSKDCQIRITDFGLARFMDESTRQGTNNINPMTEYVVTRWYRAPELLLSPNNPYDEAIDLWSVGCILAELYRRKPLFPGKSHADQVHLIFEVMGFSSRYTRPEDCYDELGFQVSQEAFTFLDKRCRYPKLSITTVVPNLSPDGLSLLESLLSVNPHQRLTAKEALESTYLQNADVICDYNKQYVTCPTAQDFEFEKSKYTLDELRSMIQKEVRYYNEVESSSPLKNTRNETFRFSRDDLQSQHPQQQQQQGLPPSGGGGGGGGPFPGRVVRQGSMVQHEQDDTTGPVSQMRTARSFGNVQQIQAMLVNNTQHAQQQQQANTTNSNPYQRGPHDASFSANIVREELMKKEMAAKGSNSNSQVPIRGMAVGNIIASARNLNATSPTPRTPKTPTPGQINQIANKGSKCRQISQSQMTNGHNKSSSDLPAPPPRQLDPLPVPPAKQSSLFSSMANRYATLSARSSISRPIQPVEERKVNTAPQQPSSSSSSAYQQQQLQQQREEEEQQKRKSILSFPSFSRR